MWTKHKMSKLRQRLYTPDDRDSYKHLIGFCWIFNKPCFLGRIRFHHESHLRSPHDAKKSENPQRNAICQKTFRDFPPKFLSGPKNVYHKRVKDAKLWRRKTMLRNFLSSYHHYHLLRSLCFGSEWNIHHKHDSLKAYSKLNLIKHSDFLLWET